MKDNIHPSRIPARKLPVRVKVSHVTHQIGRRAPKIERRASAEHAIHVRYSLDYSRLHGLVAKASSKSHSALMRLLGSRFTGVSVTRQCFVGPSYVPSTRV